MGKFSMSLVGSFPDGSASLNLRCLYIEQTAALPGAARMPFRARPPACWVAGHACLCMPLAGNFCSSLHGKNSAMLLYRSGA